MKPSKLIIDNRAKAFEDLLGLSSKLDIASAFVSSNDIWTTIEERASKESLVVRLIAGIDNAISDPKLLVSKSPNIRIRVAKRSGDGGIFHPKLYIFHLKSGEKVILLGSANFTTNGFTKNQEILFQVTDTQSTQLFVNYFNNLWEDNNKTGLFLEEELEVYTQKHEKYKKLKKEMTEVSYSTAPSTVGETFIADGNENSFSQYCSLLYRVAQERFDWAGLEDPGERLFVLLDAIEECHNLIKNHDLPYDEDDIHKILGTHEPYAVLGEQRRWNLNSQLKNNTREAKLIHEALKDFSLKQLSSNVEERTKEVLEVYDYLKTFSGTGNSRATRLLALARPDFVISYNKQSEELLNEVTGCETTDNEDELRKNYRSILQWLWSKSWFNADSTNLTGTRLQIWKNRAALIDILAYSRNIKKKPGVRKEILEFLEQK